MVDLICYCLPVQKLARAKAKKEVLVPVASISAKVPTELRDEVRRVAALEQRTASNVVRLAVEQYLKAYQELHPQFRADILEALDGVRRGKLEPYVFG
jgi:predicted transcriptional regulator